MLSPVDKPRFIEKESVFGCRIKNQARSLYREPDKKHAMTA